MILVEREGEFATLHALFADSLRARSRVAIISGGVATGKTSLLRALGEKAADSGAVFLSAVASPLEGQVPLGVVEQLFRSPGAPTAGTERFTRWLEAQVLPGPGTAVDLRGLWEILRDLAEHQPVVVGIDDIHHADEASLQCLLYLLRRLRSARLLTVLTECPRSRAANAPLQGEFLREPQSRQIRLEPLSRAGVTTLLARHLDSATARYLAPHFHQASAGHPMLVHTLIEDYLSGSRLAEPEAGSEPVAGEAFSRAVLSFLHRHQAPVMEVARAIAIMDSPTPLPLLGSLLDLDSVSTAQAVSTLAAAGILADGTFRHGAIQAAVVDGIPPDLRRSLHDRVAELLHAEGGSASEVAAHLVASDHHKSPWAISIIQEAAEQALADDDLTTGIHYLMTAQRHCGDRRQRSAIASALADAEWRVDPSRALRHLPDVLDEELLVDHASLPVTSLLWHGRVPEALGLLDTLERRPDAAPGLDTPRVWLSYLYPEHFRLGTTAGDLDDDEVTALVSELLNGDQTTSLTFAESILERFRLNHKTLAPLSIALAALIDNDRLDSAATWCDALVEESVARRSPTWRALFTALRAMVHFRQGNLAAAEQRAEAALNLISPKGWGVMVGLPLACLILTRTAMGRFQQAADLLDIDVPEAMFRTPMGLHYLYARGRHHLAVGRFHAALHDFRACGQLTDQWGVDLPSVEPWRVGAAQAHLSLGDPLKARQMLAEQLALARPGHARTRGSSLPVQAATDDLQTRSALLSESAELLRLCGDRFGLSHALHDLSDTHRLLVGHDRAGGSAHQAHVLALQCRTGALEEALVLHTGDGRSREPGIGLPGRLSDAEWRVAALAADGHTNRAISTQLCVTVSTVEQHLTKIYRKLNVKRFDLKSVLGPTIQAQ